MGYGWVLLDDVGVRGERDGKRRYTRPASLIPGSIQDGVKILALCLERRRRSSD